MRPLAALLLSLPLAAQMTPGQRTADGLRRLHVGRWEDAFQEWGREGVFASPDLETVQAACLKAAPLNRTMGRFAAFREPLRTELWERHFVLATFDNAAVFLVFDWIWHKDLWRLQRLQMVQDPTPFLEVAPKPPEAR